MKQVSAFVTYASLIVGVALAVILMVFMTPVLNMFGANEQTFLYAKAVSYTHLPDFTLIADEDALSEI